MKKAITLLRISYWAGAVLDALTAIPLLFPSVGVALFGLAGYIPTPEFNYVSYIGASLMIGWTVLLVWADRKPLERKGILLITVFPVIIGLAVSGIYLLVSGIVIGSTIIPTFILQTCLTALFLYSYFYARAIEK